MVRFERHKDSDYFKDGKYEYPPDAWIYVRAYRCSNCGEIIACRPQGICPHCRAEMKITIY